MRDLAVVDTIIQTLKSVLPPEQTLVALHEPEFRGNECSYIKECLDTGWVSSVGRYVDQFERMLAEYTGAGHAVATVNGTSALHVALKLAGVRPDQVHVIPGEPAQTLPRFAAGRYDLFVMGALTHRKTPAALVGTLTGRLLETLDCDFVLVKTPDLAARAEGGTDADAKQVGT